MSRSSQALLDHGAMTHTVVNHEIPYGILSGSIPGPKMNAGRAIAGNLLLSDGK